MRARRHKGAAHEVREHNVRVGAAARAVRSTTTDTSAPSRAGVASQPCAQRLKIVGDGEVPPKPRTDSSTTSRRARSMGACSVTTASIAAARSASSCARHAGAAMAKSLASSSDLSRIVPSGGACGGEPRPRRRRRRQRGARQQRTVAVPAAGGAAAQRELDRVADAVELGRLPKVGAADRHAGRKVNERAARRRSQQVRPHQLEVPRHRRAIDLDGASPRTIDDGAAASPRATKFETNGHGGGGRFAVTKGAANAAAASSPLRVVVGEHGGQVRHGRAPHAAVRVGLVLVCRCASARERLSTCSSVSAR